MREGGVHTEDGLERTWVAGKNVGGREMVTIEGLSQMEVSTGF